MAEKVRKSIIQGGSPLLGRPGKMFLLGVFLHAGFSLDITGQCTNGNQPECKCHTAPVLCTIDELDNYEFSMTSYQHPQDAPSPLCPPQTGTVSNNPTWFAFVAWCTTLTLEVDVENCTPFQGNVNGVQIAIYSSCNFNPPMPVACNTAASDCNTNDKILTMNNLIIGNTYYFLIDGCSGAYCDVSIDVVGVCGQAEIDEWTEPVGGPTEICAGDTEIHTAQDLHGATDYHWYIDGVLIDEGNGLNDFSYTWSTPGVYEICVDASNVPCIPESNPPLPNCLTVEVFAADAGMITANPTPVCPNDVVNISATGFETASGYTQYIVIANASGVIVDVVEGSETTFTHDACAVFTAYAINIHEAGGNSPPQIGNPVFTIACLDGCCDSDEVPFEFIDDINPVLLNTPANVTLSCYDELTTMQPLTWTDNCDGSGTTPGTETGSANLCDGGTLMREWSYTDACDNEATYVQTITIDPVPMPAFVNPPANITVDCNNIPASAPQLTVMNSGTGQCAISSVVDPVQDGMPDVCGGTYQYTWEYTDFCNRTITHVQTVTVTPIPPPVFDMVPSDVTVACDAIPVSQDLSYSNGATGACLIDGTVSPEIVGSADVCGGTINYNWTFTDQCGRTIQQSQRITVMPAPQAVFIDPPPDTTIMCDDIPAGFPSLAYSNGLTGTCGINGTVAPQVTNQVTTCGGTITLLWRLTDACNRSTEHVQVITVEPGPVPAWINPPADTMVDCAVLPLPVPSLSYSNGITGPCAISGTVAGVQTGFDVCSGIVTWEWQFTDPCGNTITHTRNITTTPPAPVIFINPPADTTVMCTDVPQTIPALAYTNNSAGACAVMGTVAGSQQGSYTACGGQLVRTWQVMDLCGELYTHTQTLNVLPAPPPAFTTLPADVTVPCNAVPAPENLIYTNGQTGACAITGSVPAAVSGSYNPCGGSLAYTWTLQDACGNTITHARNITVLPAPPPAFINPPADITLNCESVPAELPTLNYSNNQAGLCAIAGSVTATMSGSYDACGGAISYLWTFTDQCGTSINHIQQVEVLPAADPEWIDPPADTVLGCDDIYLPPDDLFYSNTLSGSCLIEGSVSAEVIFIDNVYTHTWSYLHPCTGAEVTYAQTVTIVPIPEIDLLPDHVIVCDGDVFDLSTVVVTEVNGQEITVTYHTDFPPDAGTQLGDPHVLPDDGDEFVFLATNQFGCTDAEIFSITVDPLPNAGADEEQAICSTEGAIDFTDYLSFNADPGGYWIDVDGAGVNLDNPTNVSFQFADPGTYHFQYVVQINDCPADTSVLTIILSGGPDFIVDSVYCTDANTAYTVVISGSNLVISVSQGTVVPIPGGLMVEGIPIDHQLNFDIWDTEIFCVVSSSVSPPNCDCPQVPAPVNAGNKAICVGDPIPFLEVSIAPGTTANWYDAATGGNLLAQDTTRYTPAVSMAGTYIYYVQAESEEFSGCYSNTRTPVTLTIHPLPVANDLMLTFCDTAETGQLQVNLEDYQLQINNNPANTLTFHASQADALSGTNPLSMPLTVSTGITIVFARIRNSNNCAGISQVTVELHALPEFTIMVEDEFCYTSGNTGRILVAGLDPGDLVIFEGDTATPPFEFAGLDAGQYLIEVISGSGGCSKEVMAEVGEGAEILYENLNIICNDNGTDTDPTDDYYTLELLVTNTGTLVQYYLLVDGDTIGIYPFGQQVSFVLPATGTAANILAIEETRLCPGLPGIITPVLSPCSSTCDITIDEYTQVCSDNGTPLDPSDDFHTITLTATAVNGSVSNQYGLYINGSLTMIFTYGVPGSFVVPAGVAPSIVLQDVDDMQCFINVNPEPLVTCSNLCDIPAPGVQYTCDDNGTADDAGDDFYTMLFTPVVTNPGPSNMVVIHVDGMPVTTAMNGTQVTLMIPADGTSHGIEIRDQDDPQCSVQWQSILLTPCSTQCIISLEDSSIVCDNNGTPMDPSDDVYLVSWIATSIFGSAGNTYQILLDGTLAGTGMYGNGESLVIPADGLPHAITLRDADDMACTFTIQTEPLTHCSNACSLTVSVQDAYCNNNGTNQTETDDIFFIVIDVTGINIPSGEWELQGTGVTGQIGMHDTLGPYLIMDGNPILHFIANGGDCEESIEVTAPAPCSRCNQMIDAGPDMVIDCGTPTVTLTVTSSEPGMASWTDPDGGVTPSASVNVSLAGEYIATVAFSDGCVFRDTVLVSADPTLPAVWGGPDMQLDCDISEVLLTAQVQVGTATTYEWTDAAGNVISATSSILVNTPGTYFIRIYDANVDCWSGQDAVVVNDLTNTPSALILADPGNILSCVIQSIVLSAPGEPNVLYTWVVPGETVNGLTVVVDQSGTYTLIALDTITKCQAIDSILIDVLIEYPVIEILPPMPLSCANPSVVLDASGSWPNAGGVFIWTNMASDTLGTGNSIEIITAGEYVLELSDPNNGCTSYDTVTVSDISMYPEIADAPDITLPCDMNEGTLSISLVTPLTDVQYQWQSPNGQIIGGTATNQISFSGPGTYIVAAIHAASQCMDADTIVVSQVTDVPSGIDIESTPASCEDVDDGTILLGMIHGGTPPYPVFVNGILTTAQTLEDLAPGIYHIEVEDANGCVFDTTVVINADEEVMIDLEAVVTIKAGQEHILEAVVNIPAEEIADVQWTPSAHLGCDTCLITSAAPEENITYMVVVTDLAGCTGEASVAFRVLEDNQIFIPNVITPNHDHINDFLTVFSNNPETEVLSLRIFDRWGELIFEKTAFEPNVPEIGWDGTFRGKPLNPGVFVYIAEIETRPGRTEILTGDVTIVR